MKKLIRITTVPISLEKLLEGQLAFMKSHYEVVAISAERERLQAYGKREGVRVFHLELTRKITPSKDLLAVYKLYCFLKKEKPTIVHTHTPKAGIVGMMAAWLAGVPNRLHTVAGLPLMETTGFKRKLLNTVEKLTYRFATQVYPNSKGLYDFILSEKFTNSSKLSIIGQGSSNGIDTAYFDPELFTNQERIQLRNSLNISEESFVFVFVGRLVSDKGINELVGAFIKLASKNKQTSLLLVGPLEEDLDPLLPETLQCINNHPQIHAIGYQEDVRPYIAMSDALAFPSYREGFPNVVLQAGAMGLPAIVSDINGCNEIVTHGINGLIIPPKDTKSLYETLQKLIDEPEYTQNLKSESRKKITKSFERRTVWETILTEYKSLN